MRAARRCANLLILGAERLIPAAKADWAQAMAAERAFLGDDPAAIAFCAGCFRAAAAERVRSLAPDHNWFLPGFTFGLLLVATALIPGSGTLPLLWAPLAGLLTVLMAERDGSEPSFGRTVVLALKSGLLSGAILFAFGCLVLIAAGGAAIWDRALVFAMAALAAALLVTISGIAAAPLVSRSPSAKASFRKEH